MITKPKNISQNTLLFFVISGLSILSSCKSSEPISNSESTIEPEVAEVLEVNQDSLNQILLMREKEQELLTYQPSATRTFDIVHTELDLNFDYERSAVLGEAKLTLTPYAKPQKILTLDAKDFELGKIYGKIDGEEQSFGYRYDEKQIEIYLPKEIEKGDTIQIWMKYTAFPDKNSGGGGSAITDTKGLYFIDPLDTIANKPRMIWTQGETEFSSKWFPAIDKPNDKFTQTIHLTVGDSLVTVSNGVLTKSEDLGNGLRKDTWEMTLPHSAYLAAVAIGDFGKSEDVHGDIPLGYYVEKGYEKGAAKVFANTPEMMGYFEKLTGVKFPWPKYDQIVVPDFVSGAMENTTASIFTEELKLTEREAIDSEWDYIIAHELFHQWFGDYVTAESWSNLTLNEAFANYSEYLWNEYKYGLDQAKLKLIAERETYFQEALGKQENLIRFHYPDAEELFDAHSYSKGGLILHMLRKYLGDELFFAGLNYYLNQHAFSSVEVHDLRLAFEKVSGEDLNWFFNQWFLDKGHPQIRFEVDYSIPDNLLISAWQEQDLENTPLYKLPFEVSWYVEGERKTKSFTLEQGFQQFALQNEDPVDQLYIDEGTDVLMVKSMDLDSVYLKRQFQESLIGSARYEALDSLRMRDEMEILSELIPQALDDEFWSIKELALQSIQSNPEWMASNPALEEKVFDLAESAVKNSVRAGAIDALGTLEDPSKYFDSFLKYVNDSSYLVVSSALMALVSSDSEDVSIEFIERFSGESNFRVVIPVAEYYLNNDVIEKGEWFQEKAETLNGEGLYYFLGYYAEYFVMHPEEDSQKAMEYLLHLMENSSQMYVRLGAFQGLLGFGDDEEVVSKIREIASKERDDNIKRYFDYFLQAFDVKN